LAIYIRNAFGVVHSVDEYTYGEYLTQRADNGQVYPLPGWAVISEDEARAAHPQLFGAPDPNVVPNLTEIKLERERLALRREIEAEAAAVAKPRTK
jgi:hypothetical protein